MSSIGSPIGKIFIDEDFAPHLERMRHAAEVAHFFDAPYIRIFSFFLRPGANPADHRDEVIDRMRALARVAEEADVILLHENEKEIYGDIPSRCLDIVRSVGSPHLRLAWDPANFVQVGVRPFTDGYAVLRPHVEYIQIKDALAADGTVVPAGAGDGEVAATIRALRHDGFDGFFSLEPHLSAATATGGFSGQELFRTAWQAFTDMLKTEGIEYAMSTLRKVALVGAGRDRQAPRPGDQPAGRPDRAGRGGRRPAGARRAARRRARRPAVRVADRRARGRGDRRRRGLHADRAARRGGHRGAGGRQARHHREARRDHRGPDRRDHRGPAARPARWSRSSRSTGSTRPPRSTLAAIAGGELGRLTSGIASIDWWRGQSYYDSGDWRGTWELDGGGALMNQGVHTVDLLVAALGRPVEVFAYTGTLAHERIEVEDVAAGVVRFESGALGVLHATTAAYPGLSARLQVHGDRGSVVIDNDQLAFFHATPAGSRAGGEADGHDAGHLRRVRCRPPAAIPGQLSDAHRLQYLNFLGALDGDRGAAGRPGDQPAVDRRHHRRVRVGADRTAGPPVVRGAR